MSFRQLKVFFFFCGNILRIKRVIHTVITDARTTLLVPEMFIFICILSLAINVRSVKWDYQDESHREAFLPDNSRPVALEGVFSTAPTVPTVEEESTTGLHELTSKAEMRCSNVSVEGEGLGTEVFVKNTTKKSSLFLMKPKDDFQTIVFEMIFIRYFNHLSKHNFLIRLPSLTLDDFPKTEDGWLEFQIQYLKKEGHNLQVSVNPAGGGKNPGHSVTSPSSVIWNKDFHYKGYQISVDGGADFLFDCTTKPADVSTKIAVNPRDGQPLLLGSILGSCFLLVISGCMFIILRRFQCLSCFDKEPKSKIPLQVQTYSMNSDPRGFVYVFNYKFSGRGLGPKERRGAEQDSAIITKTFTNMGYKVFLLENQPAWETRKSIDEIRRSKELMTIDALIMFFLSHGIEPYKFLAEDGEILDLQQDVWDKLTNSMCPAMIDKPKIIFANFCRGIDIEVKEINQVKALPKDMVNIHAVPEGVMVQGNPQSGIQYVQSLCEVLERHGSHCDLRKLYEELDPACEMTGGTQPKWEDNTFRTFYFNPRNNLQDQVSLPIKSFDDLEVSMETLLQEATPLQEQTCIQQSYSMKSEIRGFVYVFNYKLTEWIPDPEESSSADQVMTRLTKIFTDMGYKVFLLENQTAEETKNTIEEIRLSTDLQDVDALIMFFLSHSNEPYKFYAQDGEVIDLQQDIWAKFNDSSCPALENKPKIIFTCFSHGMDTEMIESDAVKDIPRDIVTIHAASEGVVACRNIKYGTCFVHSLCAVLRRYAKHYDLRKLYEELDPISKKIGGTQPKWEDNRFRTFYFNPVNPNMS